MRPPSKLSSTKRPGASAHRRRRSSCAEEKRKWNTTIRTGARCFATMTRTRTTTKTGTTSVAGCRGHRILALGLGAHLQEERQEISEPLYQAEAGQVAR